MALFISMPIALPISNHTGETSSLTLQEAFKRMLLNGTIFAFGPPFLPPFSHHSSPSFPFKPRHLSYLFSLLQLPLYPPPFFDPGDLGTL